MKKKMIIVIIAIAVAAIVLVAVILSKKAVAQPISRPECGGYRSKIESCTSMEDEKSAVTLISFFYGVDDSTYHIDMGKDSLVTSMCPGHGKVAHSFSAELTDALRAKVEKSLRSSGLLKYNGWSVHVSGLPPTKDASIGIEFASGRKYWMDFNGCHAPAGFFASAESFVNDIIAINGYDPKKCADVPPYVSPYTGTHTFIYRSKDGKKSQTFTFHVLKEHRVDEVELFSYGDYYESEHIKCSGSMISGGNGRYDLDIIEYYDDSVLKPSTKNSIAAIVYRINGKLYLEPYQVCPDFPSRDKIEEEKTN